LISLIVVGVIIGIYELLLRIVNHLLSSKTGILGIAEKNTRDNHKTKKNRKEIKKLREEIEK